jgi:hypothetical protein
MSDWRKTVEKIVVAVGLAKNWGLVGVALSRVGSSDLSVPSAHTRSRAHRQV